MKSPSNTKIRTMRGRRPFSRRDRGWLLAGALLFIVFARTDASAQTATLRSQRGPFYAGVPIKLQVDMRGFSAKPTCDPEAPE